MAAKKSQPKSSTQEFEKTLKHRPKETYKLRLYIAGITPRSSRAVANIKEICEIYLKGRYTLEVIDIYQQPTLAKGEQIIAAPTLIKKLPRPLRKFIGDMADAEKILVGLDLSPGKSKKKQSDLE